MTDLNGGAVGWIGVHLASAEFTVEPGGSTTLVPIVANNGPQDDAFSLSVVGVPEAWITTPSPYVVVPAGEQREAPLTIQPPRHFTTKAGRCPITIRVQSQSAAPGQAAEAQCILTVEVFVDFGSRLYPQRQAAGQPFRLSVKNRANIQEVFMLRCGSPNDTLRFEPGPTQELPLAPGQEATVQLCAWPRQRPFLGGEHVVPLLLEVESLTGRSKGLRGEVTSRASFPGWLLLGLLLFASAFVCMVLALVLTQGL